MMGNLVYTLRDILEELKGINKSLRIIASSTETTSQSDENNADSLYQK